MVAVTYTVNVTREGRNWLADVVGLPGAHTYAGNLHQLHRNVQDVIALVNDWPEDHDLVPVDLVFEDDDLITAAMTLGRERSRAAQAVASIAADTAVMVGQLTAAGYSVRDIAVALDMTPGRVSQIASGGISDIQAAS